VCEEIFSPLKGRTNTDGGAEQKELRRILKKKERQKQ
jgi:hypothetical protein